MCTWIIHAWRIWLHCLISTNGWHSISSHRNCNCIHRRLNYFYLIHIQCLPQYHYTQYYRNSPSKFTTYIPAMVQIKISKISISFKKSKGYINSINQINPRKKLAGKFWYELIKPIFITVKTIRSSFNHAVFSWVYMK